MSVSFRCVTIPAGVPVHCMDGSGWRESKRKLTVKRAEVADYGRWVVTTWPGAGGYWRRTVQDNGEYVAHWPKQDWEER